MDSIYVRDGLSPIRLKDTMNVSGRQVHTRTRRDQRRYCQHVRVSWGHRIKARVSDNLVKLPILQRKKINGPKLAACTGLDLGSI